jgi:hypothetical protein
MRSTIGVDGSVYKKHPQWVSFLGLGVMEPPEQLGPSNCMGQLHFAYQGLCRIKVPT